MAFHIHDNKEQCFLSRSLLCCATVSSSSAIRISKEGSTKTFRSTLKFCGVRKVLSEYSCSYVYYSVKVLDSVFIIAAAHCKII